MYPVIHGAAVVAGDNAHHRTHQHADDGAKERHGQRDTTGQNRAGKDIAPEPIRAQEKKPPTLCRAEEMNVGRNQTQHFVFPAADKKIDGVALGRVFHPLRLEIGIHHLFNRIDEGAPMKFPLGVDKLDLDGRGEAVAHVELDRVVGREKLGKNGQCEEAQHKDAADDGNFALAKFARDEL
jgi:hypothetical protein